MMRDHITHNDLVRLFGQNAANELMRCIEAHAGVSPVVIPICPERRMRRALARLNNEAAPL